MKSPQILKIAPVKMDIITILHIFGKNISFMLLNIPYVSSLMMATKHR